MPQIKLAAERDVPEGGMIMREHGDKQIVLAKIDGKIHAMNNICTHEGAPLHEGELGAEDRHLLTCPWHQAHFDVRTGQVHQDTHWATDTESYPVEVRDGDVFVEV